jgi:bifunctional DNA-binding transcriptional regulator/antitoxin component of YhaV-PrlF toxin-antitoxin module
MTLMRGFSRVSEKGAVLIPENMRREVGLKAGQLVELKVVGASKAKSLLVSKREAAR